MPPPNFTLLDRFSRVAPLGLRFVDAVSGRPVSNALEVVAYLKPSKRLPLFANASNLYVLQDVPGLRDFEFGAGDAPFWAQMPAPVPYTIEVRDPANQYHPFRFTAPVPTKGVFVWPDAANRPGVPLYATVGRPVPAGMANVRADLYDPQNARPAAWAVLEVFQGATMIARGISDLNGRVSIALPAPEPIDLLPADPDELGQPLSAQSWPLIVKVRYRANATPPAFPDLAGLLSQPAAHLWDAWKTNPLTQAAYPGDTLRYGRPLVLRSSGLSVLYVTV